MHVRKEHPRIWLTPQRLENLSNELEDLSLDEIKVLAGDSVAANALVYAITGDGETGREAVDEVMKRPRLGHSRTLLDAALTYDWCHDLLTNAEKETIADELVIPVRSAVEFGRLWRSFANEMYDAGWRVGLVALTLHGEHPFAEEALEFVMPEWEDALKVFANIYPDGAWGEGYNYNHHTANNALRFFLALRSAAGVDLLTGCDYLRKNGYYMIYGVKPNGLVYPGDDNDHPAINWYEREALLMANAVYRDPYYQHFINHCPFDRFRFGSGRKWIDLLWYDATIPERDIAELPLSKIFRGDGLVIARGGWEWDDENSRSGDAWVTFHCGRYLCDHAHLDNNHFEIYYRGELAIDSGRYDCDWGLEMDPEEIKRSQFFNYYKRSIAHNTLLVYDPDEQMAMGVLNDGGGKEMVRVDGVRNVPEDYSQGTYPSDDGTATCDWVDNPGRWDLGAMKGYMATEDFTYACGDATQSYCAHKLREFTRQFLYVRPDVIVVFDRVESTDPSFRKTWLLHSVEEPEILHGRTFQVRGGDGTLVCICLLPGAPVLTKVGGPGDQLMVAGVCFTCGAESTGVPSELDYGEIPGAWRVEESPSEPRERDYFLHVLTVGDREYEALPEAQVVSETPENVRLDVKAGGVHVEAAFAKTGGPEASIRIARAGRWVFEGRMPSEVIVEEEGRDG